MQSTQSASKVRYAKYEVSWVVLYRRGTTALTFQSSVGKSMQASQDFGPKIWCQYAASVLNVSSAAHCSCRRLRRAANEVPIAERPWVPGGVLDGTGGHHQAAMAIVRRGAARKAFGVEAQLGPGEGNATTWLRSRWKRPVQIIVSVSFFRIFLDMPSIRNFLTPSSA